MTQRVQNLGTPFTHEPFDGEGVSLYATIGATVQYRNLRVLTGGTRRRRRGSWIKGAGGNHDIANAIEKTARRASAADPATQINWTLDAAFVPVANTQDATFDIRRYKDHVENESYNFGTVTVPIDSAGDGDNQILGTGELVSVQIRSAGEVKIRFRYEPSPDGIQPTTFSAIRTAGPTSPSDVSVSVDFDGQTDFTVTIESLSDASAYTYKIQAVNGATTADVITGIQFTADATGPTAPSQGTAEAW